LAAERPGWQVEVQSRPEGTGKFEPVPKRWVIERTNAWTVRFRRNAKDYERTVESSEAMVQVANIHVMLRRLAPTPRPAFHYRAAA
jgi:putative transposase